MKRFLSFVMCLISIFTLSIGINAKDFEDTINHENSNAIDVLNTIKLIDGYDNGKFGPDDTLTRAQLCKILVEAIYSNEKYYEDTIFTDVPMNHWARIYIDTAYRNELMIGYGDNKFGPDDKLTYTQTARVILNALGYGELSWPDGVNVRAYNLGLYKGVDVKDCSMPCTRAHAAQMIYNAFGFEVKKDIAGETMPTGEFFLADVLGYVETVKTIGAHTYVAYQNISTGEILTTSIVLTTEVRIYSVRSGSEYRLEDDTRAPRYTVDWDNIDFYVNDKIVEVNRKSWFKNAEFAYGVFDTEDRLTAIRVTNAGETLKPGANLDVLPLEVKNDILEDKDYSIETSTITYYEEDGTYEISNEFVAGYVTTATRNSIVVNGVEYKIDNRQFIKGDFVIIYFDFFDNISDIQTFTITYVYDAIDKVVHTNICEHYIDRITDRGWYTTKDDVVANYTGKTDVIIFDACGDCIDADMIDFNACVVIIPDNIICYVCKDGSNYHVKNCTVLAANPATKTQTTVKSAKAAGFVNGCPECANKFN